MSKVFKAFIDHEPAIRRIIAQYCPRAEDVEELAQETFLKCYAAEQVSLIREPKRFLLRAARNIAVSETRRHRNKTTEYLADSTVLDVYVDEGQISPELQLNSRQKLALLTKAIASLPEVEQKILLMRKLEHLKFKQIAIRMNMSVSAVQKRAASALLTCSAYLRDHGYEAIDLGLGSLSALKPSLAEMAKDEMGKTK